MSSSLSAISFGVTYTTSLLFGLINEIILLLLRYFNIFTLLLSRYSLNSDVSLLSLDFCSGLSVLTSRLSSNVSPHILLIPLMYDLRLFSTDSNFSVWMCKRVYISLYLMLLELRSISVLMLIILFKALLICPLFFFKFS